MLMLIVNHFESLKKDRLKIFDINNVLKDAYVSATKQAFSQ